MKLNTNEKKITLEPKDKFKVDFSDDNGYIQTIELKVTPKGKFIIDMFQADVKIKNVDTTL